MATEAVSMFQQEAFGRLAGGKFHRNSSLILCCFCGWRTGCCTLLFALHPLMLHVASLFGPGGT